MEVYWWVERGGGKDATVTALVHKANVIPPNIGWIMEFPTNFSSVVSPSGAHITKSHRF